MRIVVSLFEIPRKIDEPKKNGRKLEYGTEESLKKKQKKDVNSKDSNPFSQMGFQRSKLSATAKKTTEGKSKYSLDFETSNSQRSVELPSNEPPNEPTIEKKVEKKEETKEEKKEKEPSLVFERFRKTGQIPTPPSLKEPSQPINSPKKTLQPSDVVRLPFHKEGNKHEQRWDTIQKALSGSIATTQELESRIRFYFESAPFHAFHYFFRRFASFEERQTFFTVTLPFIQKLALRLPELFDQVCIPLLLPQIQRNVILSQERIACLLANAFLCTFLPTKDDLPSINFVRIFTGKCTSRTVGKLRCLLHYFRRLSEQSKKLYPFNS